MPAPVSTAIFLVIPKVLPRGGLCYCSVEIKNGKECIETKLPACHSSREGHSKNLRHAGVQTLAHTMVALIMVVLSSELQNTNIQHAAKALYLQGL